MKMVEVMVDMIWLLGGSDLALYPLDMCKPGP